jgi:hypothetical protein
MSTIAEPGTERSFAQPTALSTQSISQSSESIELAQTQSPRRPVLNRKASGLKFNQRTFPDPGIRQFARSGTHTQSHISQI